MSRPVRWAYPDGEFGPGHEARGGGAVRLQAGPRVGRTKRRFEPALLTRVGPVDQGQPQVRERVAQGGHLPVHHGRDPRLRRQRHQHVVQPEVPVHQGRLAFGRERGRQPFHQVVVPGDLPGLGQLPLPLPAAQLAGEVAGATAETAEADRPDVHAVDGGEHVGQPFGKVGGLLFGQHGGVLPRPEHHPGHVLHQVERRADDLGVVTERYRPGGGHRGAGQRGQDAELPRHVVRGGQHMTERRPTEHE